MLKHLILKDLKRFFRDKGAWITLFAMPIIITTILGFALQSMFSLGDTEEVDAIDFAIVDNDLADYPVEDFMKYLELSPIGSGMLTGDNVQMIRENYDDLNPRKIFFKEFLGDPEIRKIARYKIMSLDEAKAKMGKDEIAGIVILSENFTRDMTLNLITPFRNETAIALMPNENKLMSSTILKALMNGYVDRMNQVINEKNVTIEQMIQYDIKVDFASIGQQAKEKGTTTAKIEQTTITGTHPIDSKGYYAIAMISMFLMFVAAMGGPMVLEEKDSFTYDRHLIAGVAPYLIILGKMAVIAVVASAQILAMVIYAKLMFGISWGNPLNVLVISATSVFTISSLGTLLCMIGSVTQSYKISNVLQNGLIQVLALFGGSYLPIEQMPQMIQTVNHYLFNGIILKAYLFNMMGYEFNQLVPYLLTLAANGVVFIGITGVLFFMKEAGKDVAHRQTQALDTAE